MPSILPLSEGGDKGASGRSMSGSLLACHGVCVQVLFFLRSIVTTRPFASTHSTARASHEPPCRWSVRRGKVLHSGLLRSSAHLLLVPCGALMLSRESQSSRTPAAHSAAPEDASALPTLRVAIQLRQPRTAETGRTGAHSRLLHPP